MHEQGSGLHYYANCKCLHNFHVLTHRSTFIVRQGTIKLISIIKRFNDREAQYCESTNYKFDIQYEGIFERLRLQKPLLYGSKDTQLNGLDTGFEYQG